MPAARTRVTVALIAALVLAIGAAGVVIALVSSTHTPGRAPHRLAHGLTSPARAGTAASSRGGTSPAGGRAPSSSARRGAAPGFQIYAGADFSAQIPAGWRVQENEVSRGSFTESKWADPGNGADSVLVDFNSANGGSPEGSAGPVRAALRRQNGYKEISWGPGELPGINAWRWVFRLGAVQRVDYFFSGCGMDFAVLGSTQPGRFVALRSAFKAVAASVRGKC